jgi:hypothetical protein
MRRLLLAAIFAALLLAPAGEAWTWPAAGAVLQPFLFDPAHPYAAGQHRGIAIAGDPGATVLAPAAGTVTFAGTVPSSGKSVTITTADGYAVTLTHLGSITVARGATVAEGNGVGTIGATGDADIPQPYVHLGVRIAAQPQGYVDPMKFLPARVPVPPALVPPVTVADPPPAAPPVAEPVPAPASDPAPVVPPAAAPDAPAPVVEPAPAAPAPPVLVEAPAPLVPVELPPIVPLHVEPPAVTAPDLGPVAVVVAPALVEAPAPVVPVELPPIVPLHVEPPTVTASDLGPVAVAPALVEAPAPAAPLVPVDAHLPESLPVESLPVESLPVESLPVESLPVESLPVESLPVEPPPVEPPVVIAPAPAAVAAAPAVTATEPVAPPASASPGPASEEAPLLGDARNPVAEPTAAPVAATEDAPRRGAWAAAPSTGHRAARTPERAAADARGRPRARRPGHPHVKAHAPASPAIPVTAIATRLAAHRSGVLLPALAAATLFAVAVLAEALGAVRMMVRCGTHTEEDPGRTGLAVRGGSPSPRSCGGLRRPVGRIRPLSPPEGQRRPHGEWHGRARHAGDGGRGRGGEVLR